MANYLERIATSAGRRATLAKPPASGPPLLPAKDLSLANAPTLVGDNDELFDLRNQSEPETHESSGPETPSNVTTSLSQTHEVEPGTTKPHDALPSRVKPVAKTAASPESLSREPPFTVHLPKTLRPSSDTKLQPLVESEQQRSGAPSSVPAKAGPAEFTIDEKPTPVVPSSDSEVKESLTSEERSSGRPGAETAGPVNEDRPAPVRQIVRPTQTEVVVPEPLPVRQVDEGPNKVPAHSTSHRAEPLPPAALPVHVPPTVVGSSARQEPSRISIGSLEVVVNNHPPVAPARPPASTPLQNEKANLERRYLDRFRLRR
jgi:hypothetical protein